MLLMKYKLYWALLPIIALIGIINIMVLPSQKSSLINFIILCLYWLAMTIYAHYKERRKKEEENA